MNEYTQKLVTELRVLRNTLGTTGLGRKFIERHPEIFETWPAERGTAANQAPDVDPDLFAQSRSSAANADVVKEVMLKSAKCSCPSGPQPHCAHYRMGSCDDERAAREEFEAKKRTEEHLDACRKESGQYDVARWKNFQSANEPQALPICGATTCVCEITGRHTCQSQRPRSTMTRPQS